jgi:predicted nucleic acid-binding protein
MKDKVFLDTNILIYAYSGTEPDKRDIALNILEEHSIVISIQVLNEFIWIMNRKYGVSFEKLQILSDIFWQRFEVALLRKSSVDKALSLANQYKYSYWDSLIIASALENKCKILYTEDMQDGQIIEGKLKIENCLVAII